MNILFLTSAAPERASFSTNEKRPPLGVGVLLSILKQAGHAVFFSDEYLEPSNVLDSEFLNSREIDFVCIYSNTICYQSTLDMFEALEGFRQQNKWHGKIIVGGPHTSFGIEDIPTYVDYIVVGEGEQAILQVINGGKTPRIITGEKVRQEDMDLLPRPAWEEFVCRNYDWTFPVYIPFTSPCFTMNTSRGCPFKCTFCSVKGIWGKTYRYMSAERIVDDLEFMQKNYGLRSVYFREDHFTLNKSRTENFCNLLIKKKLDIKWACETRADQLDYFEYQELMYKAGCRMFYIGVESGSQRMLDFFNKGEKVEQFIKAFEIAHKLGIKTYASFVIGAPTETNEDRNLTSKLINKIKPDSVGKNIFVGLPGSDLYDYIKNNNLYEFEDKFHVLYPKGYLKNIKKYYGNNSYFKVYSKSKKQYEPSQIKVPKILKKLCNSTPKQIIFSIKYRLNKFLFKRL